MSETGDAGQAAGRTFLVTGANTGIGRATAAGLARQGGRVFVASRSREKGEEAVAGIKASTGNDAVWYLPLDLADLDSVRACASAFLARGEPLHGLVNNAGVVRARGLTKQGFELMFGVNHLGHFVADERAARLPDRQRAGPGGDGVQRLPLLGARDRLRGAAPAGARRLRHARVRGLQAVQRAVQPGTRPPDGGLRGHHLRAAPGRGGLGHLAAGAVAGPAADDAAHAHRGQGAATSLYCATSPDVAQDSGKFYDKCAGARPARSPPPNSPRSCGSAARSGRQRHRAARRRGGPGG